jgi:hypothetical protein
MSMQSAYEVFKGSEGFEEVLSRANDFVTRIGSEHLIGINTVVNPSEAIKASIGTQLAWGLQPNEVVVVVWYWKE